MPSAVENDPISALTELELAAQFGGIVQSPHDPLTDIAAASSDAGGRLPTAGLLKSLLDAAPAAMLCTDTAGVILLVNAQVERLLGYPPAELVDQLIEVVVPVPLRDGHEALRRDYVQNPTPRHLGLNGSQLSARRKDGSTFPADVSLSTVAVGDRTIITVAVRDVSDRLAIESAKHKSEELFRQVAETIDVSIVLRNLDPSYFVYVSPGYERIFGYNPITTGEEPSDALRHVVPEDVPIVLADYSEQEVRPGTHIEYRITRPDGEIRWIRSVSTPVVGGDNIVGRYTTVAGDITDLKRGEIALHTAGEEKKANAAKNEFLSRMSHELRTPLNAVLGFAQLLELDDLTQEQHTAVRHILHGGRHLVRLIDDVLDIAKIEGDRLDLSLEALLMPELLTETVDLMTPTANAAHVRLSYRHVVGASQHVHGDSRRLRQVVLNLLSNAIKYNRPGGWVEVRCELSEESTLDIVVQDTGIGIPEDELPRLFTPFDRLGAQTSAIEGSGVGLALSRRLMTTMGGDLRATSKVGVGSTFTASIPLGTALIVPASIPAVAPAAGLPSAELEAPLKTLLYIEDNSSNITLMEHLIVHRSQWRMITANDGRLGLELASTRSPDLVLLDLHLPDMDGIEVLHRLQADPRTDDLRVVIVSADASPNQMNRLLAAGAYAYLTKPLDIPRVLEVLDAFVAHSPAPEN